MNSTDFGRRARGFPATVVVGEWSSSEKDSEDAVHPADNALMERLRAGEIAALDALIKRYWVSLAEYSARMLGDVDGGKDVAQEVFVRLWSQRESWQTGSVRSYLYKVARNLTIDEQRKREVRGRWAKRAQPPDRLRVPTPADVLAERELHAALERAIQRLPTRRREAFVLGHIHGLPYRQVAEVMGISSQTAANQMAMALDDLRVLLAEENI